jgi:hypothetical protein
MSDGREEREEREKRIEQERREDREDRIDRGDVDEWEPQEIEPWSSSASYRAIHFGCASTSKSSTSNSLSPSGFQAHTVA